ncbi:hypothetical protein [uncultured Rhodoblastus sp.]|uniref:hypothetical protein n=1 Tax=uncultured Rhodoblastus sp. TaxID=543037 RepID=UPI0025EEC96D|nr:hypothetical protein [uncultured Rhodoblastus sp.]
MSALIEGEGRRRPIAAIGFGQFLAEGADFFGNYNPRLQNGVQNRDKTRDFQKKQVIFVQKSSIFICFNLK